MFIEQRQKLVIGIALIFMLIGGCAGEEPSSIPVEQQESKSPGLQMPDKGHPKLDSQLNQLYQAEMNQQALAFAQERGIVLIDSSVRVVIQCVPGQVDAATEAAIAAGTEIESVYRDLLQAIVPVNKLTQLADSDSIRLVRMPRRALPVTE